MMRKLLGLKLYCFLWLSIKEEEGVSANGSISMGRIFGARCTLSYSSEGSADRAVFRTHNL
jgi:hypothetical protein